MAVFLHSLTVWPYQTAPLVVTVGDFKQSICQKVNVSNFFTNGQLQSVDGPRFFGVGFVLQNFPQKEIGRRQVRRPRRPLDGRLTWRSRGRLTWRLPISFCGAFWRTKSTPKNPRPSTLEAGHSWRNWKHWLWIMPHKSVTRYPRDCKTTSRSLEPKRKFSRYAGFD